MLTGLPELEHKLLRRVPCICLIIEEVIYLSQTAVERFTHLTFIAIQFSVFYAFLIPGPVGAVSQPQCDRPKASEDIPSFL